VEEAVTGKSLFKIRDPPADGRCSQAVLDFLSLWVWEGCRPGVGDGHGFSFVLSFVLSFVFSFVIFLVRLYFHGTGLGGGQSEACEVPPLCRQRTRISPRSLASPLAKSIIIHQDAS